MILLIFVAAVLVAIVLERQERRHRYEKTWEYQRLGVPPPTVRPKLKRTEAWLNIGLGVLMLFFGSAMAWTHLKVMDALAARPDLPGQVPAGDFWEQTAFFLAAGIALIVLGATAVRQITRYERAIPPAG